MIKAIGCILMGFAFSWISMMIGAEQGLYRQQSDKHLIDELVKENKAYKQANDRLAAKYDAD